MDADEEVGREGGGGEVIVHKNCQFAVEYPFAVCQEKVNRRDVWTSSAAACLLIFLLFKQKSFTKAYMLQKGCQVL